MRFLSNACLNLAVVSRRSARVSGAFISLAFKARSFEARLTNELPVQVVESEDASPERLRVAVRMGLRDVRKDLSKVGHTERDIPILTAFGAENVPYDEVLDGYDDPTVKAKTRAQAILRDSIDFGNEIEAAAAQEFWRKNFPSDAVPEPRFRIVPTFERACLNGSFKVTPKLRRKITAIKKGRDKKDLLVVVNKTNTVISLGIGQLGDKGGVLVPVSDEPFVLTDHLPRKLWIESSDFRRALAKDWLAIVAS